MSEAVEIIDPRTGQELSVIWHGSMVDEFGTKGGLLPDRLTPAARELAKLESRHMKRQGVE